MAKPSGGSEAQKNTKTSRQPRTVTRRSEAPFPEPLVAQVAERLKVSVDEARRLLHAVTSGGQFQVQRVPPPPLDILAEVSGLSLIATKVLVSAIVFGGDYRIARTPRGANGESSKSRYVLPRSIRAELAAVPGNATYARDTVRKGEAKKRTTGSKRSSASVRSISAGLPTTGKGHR